ncbi:MAG: MarR family transcriptional regulator [Clostridia bacterium]|nr:MarR family transcriptional regulator [Clostridia bacterium]
MEKVFENFAAVIMKLNKLIQRIKQYEMRDYGLKAIHVMCVYHLNNHHEGLTSSELVRLTLEDKAAISRALGVLQEKGYIVYDKNKYNTPVKLTDTGKELAGVILDRSSKAVEAGSANMPEEQRVMFYKFLGETADKLSEYYVSLCANDKK